VYLFVTSESWTAAAAVALIAVNVGAVAFGLPKISVTVAVAVTVPPIFPVAGTESVTLNAGPAIPLTYRVVLAPRTETVTAEAVVLVVYRYATAVVDAGVTVKDDTPEAELGAGVRVVSNLELPVVANVTGVPATTVAVRVSTSDVVVAVSLITLSKGTFTVSGAVADPVSASTAFVVTATDTVLALAGVATIVPKVMAATRPRATFLNEFIFLLV
jgi:hypothetical protein